MKAAALAVLALAVVALPAEAQRGRRCLIEVLNVDREGARAEPFPGYVNYFGGGNVRLRCQGQNVRLGGDSLVSLNGDIVFLFKNARYTDDNIQLVADSLIYSRQAEKIEARGAVTVTNLRTGSTISGPYLDYLRAVQGMRDSAEVLAMERPTVRYMTARSPRDTTGEPYVIVADRLRGIGSSRVWGAGSVTIDRRSLAGRSDSIAYLAGPANELELIGVANRAVVTDSARDSLRIEGQRVLMAIQGEDLRRVRAFGKGEVRRGAGVVNADSVSIALDSGRVSSTAAWDRTRGATVRHEGYDIAGDSIWISTPGERLREIRVFGEGMVRNPRDTTVADSAATDDERDTLWGNRIIATFTDSDSAGTTVTRLQQIEATGRAASLFSRAVERGGVSSPSITYTRADTILVLMRADSAGVQEVRARRGAEPVNGVQLERASLRQRRDTPRREGEP